MILRSIYFGLWSASIPTEGARTFFVLFYIIDYTGEEVPSTCREEEGGGGVEEEQHGEIADRGDNNSDVDRVPGWRGKGRRYWVGGGGEGCSQENYSISTYTHGR